MKKQVQAQFLATLAALPAFAEHLQRTAVDPKPLYTSKKSDVTTMDFYVLENQPKALRYVRKLNGTLLDEGAVPRATIEKLRRRRANIVDFYAERRDYQKSLSENAFYWAVPTEALSKAETHHGLFGYIETSAKHLDDPAYTLIHKSSWDHQVWDLDGKRVPLPFLLILWGTRFNLKEVEEHLKGREGVISFEIVPNECRQNYSITGTHLGELVIDPKALDLPEEADLTNRWYEDHVLHGFYGPEYDYLGLHKLAHLGD